MKLLFILLISIIFFSKCKVLPSYQTEKINLGYYPAEINLNFQDSTRELIRINRIGEEGLEVNNIGEKILLEFTREMDDREYYTISKPISNVSIIKSESMPSPIAREEIKKLCQKDIGIVSLEYLELKDEVTYRDEWDKVYDSNNKLLSRRSIVIGKKKISAIVGWRVYDFQGNVIDEYTTTDYYFYEVKGVNKYDAIKKINSKEVSSYNRLAKILGFGYAGRISAYSVYLDRNYFIRSTTSTVFENAIPFLDSNDWERAKDHWEKSLKLSLKNRDLAKLYFNLGVYHEKRGYLDKAIKALEEACYFDNKIGEKYLNELKRIKKVGYFNN